MNAIRRSALVFLFVLAAPAVLAAPMATVPMNIDGLEIDVLAVERKGNILTVKWAVRNTGSKTATVQFGLVHDKPTTFVVDEESGTKYFVLTDKEGNALATEHAYAGGSYGISDYVEAGQTLRYWMKLPAPPPAVKTVNIMFTNASEPIEGAAITDK
jgi:hypothetical protein